MIALDAISNGALAASELPKRIKILNVGKNESTQGPVILADDDIATFAATQQKLGFGRIALDYDHNTVPGSPEFKRTKEPREVAGYGVPEIVKGDGLYLGSVEYTPSGLANAKNFAGLSPACKMDAQGRLVFLHSLALCRNGSVYGLSYFSADPDKTMPPSNLADVAAMCGNHETKLGDHENRIKSLEGKSGASGGMKTFSVEETKLVLFSATGADGKVITFGAMDLFERLSKLETTLATSRDETVAAEKTTLISLFTAEGKAPIDPATRKPYALAELQKLDKATLTLLHANTPITVPLHSRSKGAIDANPADNGLKGRARTEAAFAAENAQVGR